MKRRDFVKTMAISGVAIAASDIVGDLIAQTPQGKVLESKFKGLSDIALLEAKTQGCTYADIRFTRNINSGVNASGGNRDFEGVGGFGHPVSGGRCALRRRGCARRAWRAGARGRRRAGRRAVPRMRLRGAQGRC